MSRDNFRLPWDVARCTGENTSGCCQARNDCRRFTELEHAGSFTMRFDAPTDAPLSVGCELMMDSELPRPKGQSFQLHWQQR